MELLSVELELVPALKPESEVVVVKVVRGTRLSSTAPELLEELKKEFES